jgi:hypothetical protein
MALDCPWQGPVAKVTLASLEVDSSGPAIRERKQFCLIGLPRSILGASVSLEFIMGAHPKKHPETNAAIIPTVLFFISLISMAWL